MKLPKRSRSGLAFNLTPLIDIVFNIMIFFLLTAHFTRSAESEAVDLPLATQISEEADAARRLVITVHEDGTLHLAGQPATVASVETALVELLEGDRKVQVQIRSDKDVPYGTVEPLLLMCAKHGVQDVGFKVFEAAE
ncbi:MAG: biopolymer transporter ExbD [Planctomycetaceae bacterium]|nr:biopolymer transporter ExbD [Planctomycetaceae bacterium]